MEGTVLVLGLGFWSFVAVVAVASIWDGVRKREAQHETLRRMMESGQSIDRTLMDNLLSVSGSGSRRLDRDLVVAGLLALFVALGLALLGWAIGQQAPQWMLPILGVAALVGCFGIGLWVASLAVGRWYREDDLSARNRPTE